MKQAGLIAVALMLALATPTRAQRSLDDAFRTFWRAADSGQAAAAAESIVKLTPAFDDAFQRLRKGRPYSPDVPKGVVRGSHDMAGRSFAYSLDVPPTYDPNVRYQVRFQLHGGIGRPEPGSAGPARSARWPAPSRSTCCRRRGTKRRGGAARSSRACGSSSTR